VLHLDPSPFTLRELWWMVRGHDKDEMSRNSMIRAAIYNYSGMAKQPISADELNPYAKGAAKKVSFKRLVRSFDTEQKHG